MNSIELIRHLLGSSQQWAQGLLSDMKNAPLTQPTPNGGNHPLWVLGHLLYSESTLLDSFILGKPNRFPEYEGLFSIGVTPTTDADQYPPFDELWAKFEEMRATTLAHLETLSEDDLDQPSHAPEEFGDTFGTVGKVFAAMGTHVAFHTGQVADARRAAGRPPLMA